MKKDVIAGIRKTLQSIKADFEDTNINRPFRELIGYGNSKLGIDIGGNYIATFNTSTATNCPAQHICKICNICYALREEKRYPQVLNFRKAQHKYWIDHTWEQFVKDFITVITLEKRKVKALRFNVAGDVASYNDIFKMEQIARKLPFPVYTYTAQENIYNELKYQIPDHKLVVNGSSFMASNSFVPVTEVIYNKQVKDTIAVCNGDCSVCQLCMIPQSKEIQCLKH